MSINPPTRVFRRVDPQGLRSAETDATSSTVSTGEVSIDAAPIPVAGPTDQLVEAIQYTGDNHGEVLAAAVGEVVRGGIQLTDVNDEPAPHITVEDRSGAVHDLEPGDYLVVPDHDLSALEEGRSPLEVVKPDDFAATFEEVQRPS